MELPFEKAAEQNLVKDLSERALADDIKPNPLIHLVMKLQFCHFI